MALNNMKTATITFHAPNNNGSFLQAYALQKYITTHFDKLKMRLLIFNQNHSNSNMLFLEKFILKRIY